MILLNSLDLLAFADIFPLSNSNLLLATEIARADPSIILVGVLPSASTQ